MSEYASWPEDPTYSDPEEREQERSVAWDEVASTAADENAWLEARRDRATYMFDRMQRKQRGEDPSEVVRPPKVTFARTKLAETTQVDKPLARKRPGVADKINDGLAQLEELFANSDLTVLQQKRVCRAFIKNH